MNASLYRQMAVNPVCIALLSTVCLMIAFQQSSMAQSTISIAARDSSPTSIERADLRCAGDNDQDVINQAIKKLPEAGGTVILIEGSYNIRKTPGTLGGISIDRSNVTLTGQGSSSRLRLASGQNTNVIRILGPGVGNITIRDLSIDANRAENALGTGDPNVSHSRFEYCGIKAFRQDPHGVSAAEDCHNITIQNCHVHNAHRLGIMLEGPNMRVLDNYLGDAGSDVVEILTGPGIIRGNTIDIRGRTHVAIGTDRANNVVISQNIVRVHSGGNLDIAYRTWAGSVRHAITGNVLEVNAGGNCSMAMDLRGTRTSVTGNVLIGTDETSIKISGGHTNLTGNVIENMLVIVDAPNDADEPIVFHSNNWVDSSVKVVSGTVIGLDERKGD